MLKVDWLVHVIVVAFEHWVSVDRVAFFEVGGVFLVGFEVFLETCLALLDESYVAGVLAFYAVAFFAFVVVSCLFGDGDR